MVKELAKATRGKVVSGKVRVPNHPNLNGDPWSTLVFIITLDSLHVLRTVSGTQ